MKRYEQVYNDGVIYLYNNLENAKNPTGESDVNLVCWLRYGESSITSLDTAILEGHEISQTMKIKVPFCKFAKPGLHAVIQDFRMGNKKLYYVYNMDYNPVLDSLFLMLQEVRHAFN